MKAAYQALAIVVPLIIVVLAAAALAVNPSPEPAGPDPEDPPVPGYDLPDGITYDASSRTLSSRTVMEWHIFDELHAYSEGNDVIYEGYGIVSDRVALDPSRYTVTVNGESFGITVSGKVSRTADWYYAFNGTSYPVSVTYSIDIDEYIGITGRSQLFNFSNPSLYNFTNLPEMVTVNDTVCDIVVQLEKRFAEIGGSVDDGQSYAEFLASMAQVSIEYPIFDGRYSDEKIWGVKEYWQDTVETLYHLTGDCEDKSALACALFAAAGFKAAMCGVPGHVVAGIALDGFRERTVRELEESGMRSWVVATGKDVTCQDRDTVYYAVETIKEEQHYIGYLDSGLAKCIGQKTVYWGMGGFYPVDA